MSTSERGPRPSGGRAVGGGAGAPASAPAAPVASSSAASTRACGGAAQPAAGAVAPQAPVQPPPSPAAAAAGAADAPVAGLAAPSLHSPGSGGGAAAGGGAPATGQAPPPASTSLGAGGGGGGGAASRGGGPPVVLDDDGVALSAEAAASPFSPPATARHAAFLKLVDTTLKAGLQMRHMRAADFAALAAEAGAPLFGADSLIVAYLRVGEAHSLYSQGCEELKRGPAGHADALALARRGWVVLLAQAMPIIQGRMDKGTLLPGKLRKVEEAFEVYQRTTAWMSEMQPLGEQAVRLGASALGFEAALFAATLALDLLQPSLGNAGQRSRAQAFVLAALRLIPLTAGLPAVVGNEHTLVDKIERLMTPDRYGPNFCASVLAVWRSREVEDVLRWRGSLQGSAAAEAATQAEFAARQQADLAKNGLRACALLSCGKQETTVLQFRVCGHCQTTRYCCPEHAKLHWKAHKREYEEEGG